MAGFNIILYKIIWWWLTLLGHLVYYTFLGAVHGYSKIAVSENFNYSAKIMHNM